MSNDWVKAYVFWPAEWVDQAFGEADAARGTPDETAALRVFARRMRVLRRAAAASDFDLGAYAELAAVMTREAADLEMAGAGFSGRAHF
jgi:hypothetical protein